MKRIEWPRHVLIVILLYEGLAALAGGSLLILSPKGQWLGMSVDLLRGVFPDFLFPGVALAALGGLSCIAAFQLIRSQPADWKWSGLSLGGWWIWFVVEIIVTGELNIMHAFWGIPFMAGMIMWIPVFIWRNADNNIEHRLYLIGLFSCIWLMGMNGIIPLLDHHYDATEQTVSELSATGAPTRIVWILVGSLYPFWVAFFGWTLVYFQSHNRWRRMAGICIVLYGLLNVYWPPMHLRDAISVGQVSVSDTLHLLWTSLSVLLFILIMVLAAVGASRHFQVYTLISLVLLALFGILTSSMVPLLERNEPTLMMGIWERCNIGIFLVWMSVVSIQLFRSKYRLLKMNLHS